MSQQDLGIPGQVALGGGVGVVDHLAKRLPLSGLVPSGTWVALLGNFGSDFPTDEECEGAVLATMPVG